MNLKTKRLVRTPHSEQYALFDLDRTDENFDPLSVGKLDIHYTQHGIYGTLLFWEEACESLVWEDVLRWAESFVADFQTPMGVPGEYAIELFCPALEQYELLSNIDSDGSVLIPDRPDDVSDSDEVIDDQDGQFDPDGPYDIGRSFSESQSSVDSDEDDENDFEHDLDDSSDGDDIDDDDDSLSLPSRRLGIHGSAEWIDD